jgi:transcriptional regulator with XRE-family HTH domain
MNFDQKYKKEIVGAIVHALRLERNIGQEELAQALGISQGTVSKIEHGVLELGLSTYYDFLNYIDLGAEDFSDLIDIYIKVTLKAQKSKNKEEKILKLIKEEFEREMKYKFSHKKTVNSK